MPDIVFQISSGLYGARDKTGKFDEDRYQKWWAFVKWQKSKLLKEQNKQVENFQVQKVTPAIAYYRNVEAYKDVFLQIDFLMLILLRSYLILLENFKSYQETSRYKNSNFRYGKYRTLC